MVIEIAVGRSSYQINCAEGEKEKILQLANKLNQRVNRLSLQMKNADEKTLLVIAALMSEEEAENKVPNDDADDEPAQLNEQDIYDAVSENMENVADFVEKLTKKIQDY